MHQDADALVAALARPSLTIGGRRVAGVPFSVVEVATLAEEARALTPDASLAVYRRFAAKVFDLLFPRPWWAVWRRRMSTRLLAYPPDVWVPLLQGFSAALVARGTTSATEPVTPPSEAAAG